MSPQRAPSNLGASVRARLLNLSRQRKSEFQQLLSEYAIERLLYRLGKSGHADHFVLKGAMLLKLWPEVPSRATWDLDLLGRGAGGMADVAGAIRDICAVACDDGIMFDSSSMVTESIAARDEPVGVRVRFEARLAEARIPMCVDVGFGDEVTPEPVRREFPTLLEHAPPVVLAYPLEAVVAEKLDAIISLGVATSRMKDFYDIHSIAASFAFEREVLGRAIRATFSRRGTPISNERPLVLTREFLSAPERQVQWRAFMRRGRLVGPPDAGELADTLWLFVGPVLTDLAGARAGRGRWRPGGPWL